MPGLIPCNRLLRFTSGATPADLLTVWGWQPSQLWHLSRFNPLEMRLTGRIWTTLNCYPDSRHVANLYLSDLSERWRDCPQRWRPRSHQRRFVKMTLWRHWKFRLISISNLKRVTFHLIFTSTFQSLSVSNFFSNLCLNPEANELIMSKDQSCNQLRMPALLCDDVAS